MHFHRGLYITKYTFLRIIRKDTMVGFELMCRNIGQARAGSGSSPACLGRDIRLQLLEKSHWFPPFPSYLLCQFRDHVISDYYELYHMSTANTLTYEGCSKSKVTFQFSPATYIQVLNFCCCCVGTLVTIIC